MSSCCKSVSGGDNTTEQNDQENKCLVTDEKDWPTKAKCPVSGTTSRLIQQQTLEHLLIPTKINSLQKVPYYYCKEPACNVVYFSNEKAPFFTTSDIAVKIFAKDQGDDVPVCYCFNWTRARIMMEISDTGKSSAASEITHEIKTGNCNCDIKNPKGECCLGDINAFVKKMLLINQ